MSVYLEEKSKAIRRLTLRAIHSIGVGHIGGCLSVVEALTALYFGGLMRVDPENPRMEERDRLVVSKGHAGPTVYAALALKGYFPEEELDTLNKLGTKLPSHCDMTRTIGIDMTAGSLGQGLSCAVGIALGCRLQKNDAYVYAIIGDGESQEGQIWEAAMLAAHKGLDNLIAFTDWNKLQIDGTVEEVNSLGNLPAKWEAFGWRTYTVDGHDTEAIIEAVRKAQGEKSKPVMIILDTVKGKGMRALEGNVINHNCPLPDDLYAETIEELG